MEFQLTQQQLLEDLRERGVYVIFWLAFLRDLNLNETV
jgi:hypothetical protein